MDSLIIAQTNLGAPSGGGGVGQGAMSEGVGTGPAAPGAAEGAGPGPGGSCEGMGLIFFMIAVFYLLLIRPQQKRAKKHQELVSALKKGDQVITNSGIFGSITEMDERTVTVEIAKGTRVKMLKGYVGGLATDETEKEMAQGPQQ
ncbi:MAG: preprotein translocase subunit YajC [Myxococcota bacterium]|nr:preprotein translocase subunit YajC [Myxococcota bacterium]